MCNMLSTHCWITWPRLNNMHKKERKGLMFGDLQKDNVVVGYLSGKVIAMDEWDNVYYCTMPEKTVAIGEVLPSEDLRPISELPASEQRDIGALVAEL